MTIRIDEKRIFEAIEHRKPRSVALNGPEALIPKLQDVADHIAEMFDVQVYIIGDTCWGSCDLNTHAADMLAVAISGTTVCAGVGLRARSRCASR